MPIGMPGCPEFAACTASIVKARMAFDMRCLTDGFGMCVSGGLGTIKSVT
jgi:dihydroxyacid dehydratase/phosphogluconate dehydratase